MSYFATQYTIHFDDTMAYGSHHFLTSFKFQCFSRESFLFGEQIFDVPGVREALDGIHLLTADAYARNLNAARLGDRLAILLTLEEWQRASARFCYRVIDLEGRPVCAGFQTLICADATTSKPLSLPAALWNAMEALRSIEEPLAERSFRDRILAGGSQVESLFGPEQRQAAVQFLSERNPSPQVVPAEENLAEAAPAAADLSTESHAVETWVFAGQGAFEARLLNQRVRAYSHSQPTANDQLARCGEIAAEFFGQHAHALVSGSAEQSAAAVQASPGLSQVAIHLQNVLGAELRRSEGHTPTFLTGHSFGEIAAFGVAGCFDLPTGVRVVCERVRAIEQFAPANGGLLAVAADRQLVATEVALAHLHDVVIAGRNHDQQTIVSGPREQLNEFGAILRELEIPFVVVPSPTSFHHPHLRSAALAWLEQLKSLPLTSPTTSLYSSNGRRFVSQNDDIAVLLASQMLKPFDFQGGIADLLEAGTSDFVDCGSPGTLANIIGKAAPAGVSVTCLHSREATATQQVAQPRNGTSSGNFAPQPEVTATPRRNGKHLPAKEELRNRNLVPPIAIVGTGCVLPGGVASPEQLYQAIMEQRTGIVDQRTLDPHWEADFYAEKLTSDRSTSLLGGSVEDRTIIAPPGVDREAFRRFSRTQKLLCMALAPCVEALKGAERVICLVGATADGFEDQDIASSLRFAGVDPSIEELAERINSGRSKYQEPHDAVQEVFDQVIRLGLEVILLDAACASSLYTVALGMQALEANLADAVIAGGVFCPGPGNSCLFSQFRGSTSTGLRPFDADADGVVFSEGAAIVTLRREADAKQLGLPISAVMRGVGLSSDGRSSSANVPQTRGQLLALERCYTNYQIPRGSVDAVEAHGTSTPVGDATEVETLGEYFSGHTPHAIPIHSLKGLLGHAGWAAGTASIVAACEYLRNGIFPAQANHQRPSKALLASQATLRVLEKSQSLASQSPRIAIDGFGFGGANAHVVLDHARRAESGDAEPRPEKPSSESADEELVFVAVHEVEPTASDENHRRFDRENLTFPEGHFVLPDLSDDMDITQKLAVLLVEGILAQLPTMDTTLQQETGVLLAQSGKSERGVEATFRILAQRLQRDHAEHAEIAEAVDSSYETARPSGPYTLQGMMPNVASGRAMLQFNLNGPNFVVDAASRSLEAALEAATLLLGAGKADGTKLVIATAINANPWRVPHSQSPRPEEEFAAAFAVTTRGFAKRHGMKVLAGVEESSRECWGATEAASRPTSQKVRALVDRLSQTAKPTDTPPQVANVAASQKQAFPVHAPVWVEAATPNAIDRKASDSIGSVVVLAAADLAQVTQLSETLPNLARRYLIVVVGSGARQVAEKINSPQVTHLETEDPLAIDLGLTTIDQFHADVIVAFESMTSWGLTESLHQVASNNSLCECLFLIAQRNVERLRSGQLRLWGLFHNAYQGAIHPATGAVAGLLKSIDREIGASRAGIICTADRSIAEAFHCLHSELHEVRHEKEILYDGNRRKVRRLRLATATESRPQFELDSHSVVVATGGVRGVTAVLVEALLRDYQCTVVALGRSAPLAGPENYAAPEVQREFFAEYMRNNPGANAADMNRQFERVSARWEVDRTIRQLSAHGGRVEFVEVDITDGEQVSRVIDEIVSKHGTIDLLLHGAGVQYSKRLEHRTLEEFRRTYSVKLAGLQNLVENCSRRLGHLVPAHILSSAYSVFGNDGQHDYGAANETLDRLCGLTAHTTGPFWSSIAWLAWDGIGMTRGTEYQALSRQRGLSGITASDGQQIFRRVIEGKTGSHINVPLSDSEHTRYAVTTIAPTTAAVPGRVLERSIDLTSIDCLAYHQVRETPTLPGAWILDRMVATALQLLPDSAEAAWVTIHNATFHRFVRHTEQELNVRVVAEQVEGNQIAVWLMGDLLHESGTVLAKDLVFADATVSFSSEPENMQPAPVAVGNGSELTVEQHVEDPYCHGNRNEVHLSGPFDCLREIAIGSNGRRARFVPTDYRMTFSTFPALVLDAALRVGAMYAGETGDELFVPIQIGRIVAAIGARAESLSASECEIRTTVPCVEGSRATWQRTEALDQSGTAWLVVEEANAKEMK